MAIGGRGAWFLFCFLPWSETLCAVWCFGVCVRFVSWKVVVVYCCEGCLFVRLVVFYRFVYWGLVVWGLRYVEVLQKLYGGFTFCGG